MPLKNPRQAKSLGFRIYPFTSDVNTLADPETIVWSSIRHLCSRDVAEHIAINVHGIRLKRDIRSVGYNLKLYIQQASEFYDVANIAKPNTAPLIYYYSFLNLAKALCEIRNPGFHKRTECYRHGVSWRPSPDYLVNPEKDEVALTARGVWHVLWESLVRKACPASNPTKLRVRDLFLYSPEISLEAERAFGAETRLVDLVDPDILYDEAAGEAWIQFSVDRSELKFFRISANALIDGIKTPRSGYREVRSQQVHQRTFESTVPVVASEPNAIWQSLQEDIRGMNIFCHHVGNGQIDHAVPLQVRLPLPLPQLTVLYTTMFWLGSLVRYDPHSVSELMDSRYWTLIDGFMSQSRLWLLELFEWALYQSENTLSNAR